MSGRKSELSELEARKQLLVAESELQRTLIREDWCALEAEFYTCKAKGKSALAVLSTTGLAAAGPTLLVGTFRKRTGDSWYSRLFSATKIGASLWFAARNRSHSDSE